ncbi:MOSC domain-containing protein [Actinacidiphila guanduensis]|uniref:MOSC domain-containing protein YiiM n=1 Tax=Actinacidiphila guanduensis TaxID=310781 RepID=A0A1H0HW87_9ACTN|nr:MOSC domain-containing protein [Actinacidiphila guanduensis]SDO23021.1 MOSC domain-containing protein YiiM [Actinacidiphila guanduensis]
MHGTVVSVSRDTDHRFSKPVQDSIRLLAGLGVEGDAHLGTTVQHRSRVAKDPTQPNLRQVHLIHSELFTELRAAGYDVAPGDLGENITTAGLDLHALPTGTRLGLGPQARVEITGLRNPCLQIDAFRAGLLKRVVWRDEEGRLVLRGGVMGVVLESGTVQPGDAIGVELPATPHRPLERV